MKTIILTEINKLSKHQVVKFLGTGLLNTVFGYSIYATLVYVGIPYLAALLISTSIGVIFNFFSFGRIVFYARSGLLVFGKFVTCYGAVFFFNAFSLDMLVVNLKMSPYVAQVLCIIPSVIMSWILLKYWVYKRS